MKKIFVVLILFSCIALKAQVPGYMGKRMILGVENSASLNFPVLLYLDKYNRYYFGPAVSTAFRMDYVLSNRKALSVCVRHFSKKFQVENYAGDPAQERLHLIFYSVGMKRYTRRSIAPLGFFTKWEAADINGWIHYKPWLGIEERGRGYVTVEHPGGTVSLHGVSGAFSIGTQRIFRDKFAVEYGARAALYLPFGAGVSSYEKTLVYESTEAYTFPVFNIFIGVGLAAF